MVDNIAGALGGPVGGVAAGAGAGAGGAVAAAAQTAAQTAGNSDNPKTSGVISFPREASAVPAWGIAQSLGSQLAKSFLEKNPDWAASVSEEDLTKALQALMNEVTKSFSTSLDYLEELNDDEEDSFAGAQLYRA